jgi:hypothetical protein
VRTYVVGAGFYDGRSLSAFQDQAEFRRATRNQILAYIAVEESFELCIAHREKITSKLGMVVATGHGELEVTRDFLGELRRSGTARPLLFQNSLHNATLGFLTKMFQIRGPALTVSQDFLSGESALQAAQLLLMDGALEYCLVVGVDTKVRSLEKVMARWYPPEVLLNEGAGAILLANEVGLKNLGSPAGAFQISEPKIQTEGALPHLFYDSDAIELLARQVRRGHIGEVRALKPDGRVSLTTLSSL